MRKMRLSVVIWPENRKWQMKINAKRFPIHGTFCIIISQLLNCLLNNSIGV